MWRVGRWKGKQVILQCLEIKRILDSSRKCLIMTRRFYVLEGHTEVYIGNPQGYVGFYLESEHSIQTGTRSHSVGGTARDEYPWVKQALKTFKT